MPHIEQCVALHFPNTLSTNDAMYKLWTHRGCRFVHLLEGESANSIPDSDDRLVCRFNGFLFEFRSIGRQIATRFCTVSNSTSPMHVDIPPPSNHFIKQSVDFMPIELLQYLIHVCRFCHLARLGINLHDCWGLQGCLWCRVRFY